MDRPVHFPYLSAYRCPTFTTLVLVAKVGYFVPTVFYLPFSFL
jgi:hypothetical protein